MVLNDAFMKSWQPAINNLYKQYGAPYGNGAPPPDGALADAKSAFQQRQKNYNTYMNQLEHPKLTYQDAVDYFNSSPQIKASIKNKGAYATAEGIRNDPTQQAAIKKQGYNVTDYINALYNAASDGKFASERAYNQYTKQLKSQVSAAKKVNPLAPSESYSQTAQDAITSAVQGKKTKAAMVHTPVQAPQHSGGIGGFLGNIGHDLQRGYDRLIVKPVSAIANAIDSGVQANHDIKSGKRNTPETLSEIKDALVKGYQSNTPVSFSKVLNDMGSKNKTVNNLVGGATDFTLNPLNLVPYIGAEKLLGEGGLKVGSKLASKLTPKLGHTISHTIGKGLEGAAAGSLGASADASLNPHLTPQERLSELLQMGALGGVGGALHGGLEGGSKALDKRIADMLPKNPYKTDLTSAPQGYTDTLNRKALPAPSLYGNTKLPASNEQLQSVEKALEELHNTYQSKLNDHVTNGSNQIDQAIKDLQDQYKQGLDDHVGNGMNAYLQKDSTRQAYADLAKEYKAMRDAFPNGIKIPDHLQSDYKGLLPKVFKETKKGASSDLASAAEQMGFNNVDEFVQHLQNLDAANKAVKVSKLADLGHSTANQAEKALQDEFHGTPNAQAMRNSLEYLQNAKPQAIEDLKNAFHQTPDAKAIQMSIDHLNQAKEHLANEPGGVMRNDQPLSYVGNNPNPIATKLQNIDPKLAELSGLPKQEAVPPVNNEPHAINIDQAPEPVKLTPNELAREANKEQFAQNNLDPTIPDTADHITSKSDLPKEKSTFDTYYTNFHDNLDKIKQFQNAVVDAKGKEIPASDKTYEMSLNSRNADVTAERLVRNGMVDSHGNPVLDENGQPVGSLEDITKGLKPKQFKAFTDYLTLKHAETRMSRGEKVYPDEKKMSPEKAAAKAQAYEEQLPHFKELADKVYTWNRALLKHWVLDPGLITEEEFNHFIEANPHYVPMNRVFTKAEKNIGQRAKKGFVGQTKPTKAAPGSERQIIDPIESMIEHAEQYVKTARRNEVGQSIVRHISEHPNELSGWAEINPTEKGIGAFADSLGGKLQNDEDLTNLLDQLNEAYDQKPDPKYGNSVNVMVDGKPVNLKIHDPQFLDALTNIGPTELPKWISAIGKITRSFKVLTTGTNPIFVARNMTRDIPMAYANSKTLPKGMKGQYVFARDLLKAYIDVAKKSENYQSFRNMGGGHASSVASNADLLAKTKASILPSKSIADLKDQGKSFATARYLGDKIKKAHNAVISKLEGASNIVETAPRLAEYNRTVKQGGGTYDSKIQGLYNANDVTVNFNRFGTQAKQLDQLVPYLNASIQGIDKFGRAIKDNPGTFAARLGVGVGLPATLIYLANANDPNYQQLPKYLKDQYFMVPRGDGTFFKIAKPREIGAVVDGIERTLDALQGDPHAWQDYGNTLLSNFLPPTQAIDAPLMQVNANKSFTGAPIVSQSLKSSAPKYQYDAKDTGFSKNLAKVTSLLPMLPDGLKSPKDIDYLLKSYGGGAAQLLTAPKRSLSSSFTADPTYSNDIGTNFYNEKTKLDQARDVLMKKGIKDPSLNEPLRQTFDAQARQVSKIRKAMNATKDPKQKRLYQQMINQLEQKTNTLAK